MEVTDAPKHVEKTKRRKNAAAEGGAPKKKKQTDGSVDLSATASNVIPTNTVSRSSPSTPAAMPSSLAPNAIEIKKPATARSAISSPSRTPPTRVLPAPPPVPATVIASLAALPSRHKPNAQGNPPSYNPNSTTTNVNGSNQNNGTPPATTNNPTTNPSNNSTPSNNTATNTPILPAKTMSLAAAAAAAVAAAAASGLAAAQAANSHSGHVNNSGSTGHPLAITNKSGSSSGSCINSGCSSHGSSNSCSSMSGSCEGNSGGCGGGSWTSSTYTGGPSYPPNMLMPMVDTSGVIHVLDEKHDPMTMAEEEALAKKPRDIFQSVVECGQVDKNGIRRMTAFSPFFGKEVQIYTAANDPDKRVLYRASALAEKFGCATNKIGMYLARRRNGTDGIFQAVRFKTKPSGRTGLKSGAYFISFAACKAFEAHFKQQGSRKSSRPLVDHPPAYNPYFGMPMNPMLGYGGYPGGMPAPGAFGVQDNRYAQFSQQLYMYQQLAKMNRMGINSAGGMGGPPKPPGAMPGQPPLPSPYPPGFLQQLQAAKSAAGGGMPCPSPCSSSSSSSAPSASSSSASSSSCATSSSSSAPPSTSSPCSASSTSSSSSSSSCSSSSSSLTSPSSSSSSSFSPGVNSCSALALPGHISSSTAPALIAAATANAIAQTSQHGDKAHTPGSSETRQGSTSTEPSLASAAAAAVAAAAAAAANSNARPSGGPPAQPALSLPNSGGTTPDNSDPAVRAYQQQMLQYMLQNHMRQQFMQQMYGPGVAGGGGAPALPPSSVTPAPPGISPMPQSNLPSGSGSAGDSSSARPSFPGSPLENKRESHPSSARDGGVSAPASNLALGKGAPYPGYGPEQLQRMYYERYRMPPPSAPGYPGAGGLQIYPGIDKARQQQMLQQQQHQMQPKSQPGPGMQQQPEQWEDEGAEDSTDEEDEEDDPNEEDD